MLCITGNPMLRRHSNDRLLEHRATDSTCEAIIRAIEQGDMAAVSRLWDRTYSSLVRHFKSLKVRRSACEIDEEQLALDVFVNLYSEIREGRFAHIVTWSDFWSYALRSAKIRFASQRQSDHCLKRGGRSHGFNLSHELDAIPAGEPPTSLRFEMLDELTGLLLVLQDDLLSEIVRLRVNDSSIREVADQLHLSVRSVQLRLQRLAEARVRWAAD
jgi:DNA-directed RNA polymerase specialized sigma24 family protein